MFWKSKYDRITFTLKETKEATTQGNYQIDDRKIARYIYRYGDIWVTQGTVDVRIQTIHLDDINVIII